MSETTDFDFTDLISFGTIEATWLKDQFPKEWNSVNSSWQVYLKLHKNVSQDQIDDMLGDINKELASHEEDAATWQTDIKIQNVSEIHYDLNVGLFDHSRSVVNVKTLNILLAVAIALLAIAIFNFINLETAQAIKKSKEVGLRKAMGISKTALIGRFLTESTLVTFIAAVVALPISFYGVNLFSEFVPDGFSIGWEKPIFWALVLLLILLVGFLSGIYPAFIVSSFSPVQALKSTLKMSTKSIGSGTIRKVLITSQFVFSQLLVICTIAVVWQISYMLDKEVGFKDEGVVYFKTPHYEQKAKRDVLLNEIRSLPQIQTLSVHKDPPAMNGWSTSTMKYYDQDSVEYVESVHQKQGDLKYFDLYELELVAGRNIRKAEGKIETVINETYARTLGFDKPEAAIGVQFANGKRVYEVVGILKDFYFQSLHFGIEPLMYTYGDEYSRCIGISVASDDIQPLINELNDTWSKIYPDASL
ncbi:MAG: FtsX-like permease family protein [Ekhidna sp.]|nr:FtsX-like permease family protein [Ekhidna sp.]